MDHLPFPFAFPTSVSFMIFAAWLFLFVTGREQLKRITRRTEALVLERVKVELKNDSRLTLDEFYKLFLPEWRQMLQKSAWYVTHKTELFPIPARPNLVIKRIGMDENYIGRILLEQNIELAGYTFKKAKRESLQQLRLRKKKNA